MKDMCTAAELFRDVVVNLEQAEHKLCILHGYESYPEEIASDKDIDAISEDPKQVARILHESGVASLVQVWHPETGGTYRLHRLHRQCNGRPVFLVFDLLADLGREGHLFLKGNELVRTCRRFRFFNVPSPELEFACLLIRRLMKGSLDTAQGQRLSELYRQETTGCTKQLARFLPWPEADLVAVAARSGEWEPVRHRIERLRQALLGKVRRDQPLETLKYWLRYRLGRIRGRFEEFVRPPGLVVGFLGPDGAGKSTVAACVEQDLAPAFSSVRWYRSPLGHSSREWMQRYRWGRHLSETPRRDASVDGALVHHNEPPRGLLLSLFKLGSWWIYTLRSYVTDVRPLIVNHAMVIFDRHFWDLLVYPKHFRYGGPIWLARFVGRFVPHPDLVILLDAPAEVIQGRKQEVPFEETARQREGYLKVVERLSNAHVVDASKSLDKVVGETERIILGYLADRTTGRLKI